MSTSIKDAFALWSSKRFAAAGTHFTRISGYRRVTFVTFADIALCLDR